MRSLASTAAALLLFGASPAMAQGFGLDLSDDDDSETSTESAYVPAQPPPASAEELARQQAAQPDEGLERAVTQDDRVKAVQRKHFLKRDRLEVVPSFALSLNDAFYTKVGGGVAVNYHFADSLALSLHYDKFGIVQTDNVRIAKRELRSLLLSSKLDWTAGADVVWTPIYGKLAFGDTIVAYDLFLLSGVGVAWSQTSGKPVDDGAHPAIDIGVGQRFAMFDFMAFEFWVKQLLYVDRPQDRQISEIQKVLTLNVGLSFWLPGSFSYENP